MDPILDLFGDPVPEGWGRRGRPQHIATQQNRSKVTMLLALGWNNERIAKALGITPPTLRRNYFRELKFRDEARDRLDGRLAMLLWQQSSEGNVAAMKEMRKLIERNDLMGTHLAAHGAQSDEPRKPKLGKKDAAKLAAQQPDIETTIGELMAQRRENLLN